MRSLASPLAVLAVATAVVAQTLPDPALFTAGTVTVDGHSYPFRLLEPLPEQRALPVPLVVFLHGAGERGADNLAQLRWLPQQLAEPARRAAFPCYLLAVQCPAGERWVDVPWDATRTSPLPAAPSRAMRAVLQQIDVVVARPDVDAARVYLTGLSMGGFGAFDLVARAPERFAAVLAVCGGGGDPAQAPRLVDVPFQIWHGAEDKVVPVQRSRQMVDALRTAGAAVDWHELPGIGHDSWRQAYGETGLGWLFGHDLRQQWRGPFAEVACVPALDEVQLTGGTFVWPERPVLRAAFELHERIRALPELLDVDLDWLQERDPRPRSAGEIEFRIVPEAPRAFAIIVTDRVDVVANTPAALARSVLALTQLRRGSPGGSLPCGRFAMDTFAIGNRVVLPACAEPFAPLEFAGLLRECRAFAVDEVVVGLGNGPPFPTDILDLAQRLGLVLGDRDVGTSVQVLRSDGDPFAWLRLPRPAAATGPVPFHVVVPETCTDAASMHAYLQGVLPAASERAHRSGVLSPVSLRGRVARLRRG